jgi:hypothetical protein
MLTGERPLDVRNVGHWLGFFRELHYELTRGITPSRDVVGARIRVLNHQIKQRDHG